MYPHRVKLWTWLFGAALLASQALPVTAQTGLTQSSPFARFSDEDYKAFFASVQKAANGPVGGPAINWSNASSGAHGDVRSVRAEQRPEGDCRELQGRNTTRNLSEPYRVLYCKDANGQWRLLSTLPRGKSSSTPDASAAATPAAPITAAATATAKRGFPTTLPASFSGVLPCADCPGIEYHVDFRDDGSYRLRMTYQERGPNGTGKDVDDSGAWQLVMDSTRVTLRSDGNTTTTFAIIDPDTLRLLDKGGDEFKTKLNYDLRRATTYTPIGTAR